jgi:DMSO/TMAO reductase YedYZ molybdopterin-dependent catalytic subunit
MPETRDNGPTKPENAATPSTFPEDLGRRAFLGSAGLLAATAAGVHVPLVAGSSPAAAQSPPAAAGGGSPAPAGAAAKGPQMLDFPGKNKGLVVLGDRPLVAETPESLLDDDTTPIEKFYIRNNGQMPEATKEPDAWKITIDGEVEKPLTITLGELKSRFPAVTRRIVVECGGNGRAFYTPQARGNQWTNGGVGCAEWTGVRLADVLKAAGVKPSALFTGHYGADPHLSGEPNRVALSRGVPITKAMDENNLIVWGMNGEPLPLVHGFPVRLVIAGWPGSVSSKWLTRIWVRDKIHDGQGMGGTSYRVPVKPIIPGSNDDGKSFKELESMPVRAIITNVANGAKFPAGTQTMALRGAAWAGDYTVKQVDVSIDNGATWQPTQLSAPKNPFDWQRWTASIKMPSDGYYELWARATDSRGVMQPHTAVNWNPQGYGANPMHRIAVLIG